MTTGALRLTTMEALEAHRALTDDLMQWAPVAHRLVHERIEALRDAYGPRDHPLESNWDFAARVLAKGQQPFPQGVSIHDDLNSNISYEHVTVGYGTIEYQGVYPHWRPDDDYQIRIARITVPAWLVTEPDGIVRYDHETADMVAAVTVERAAEAAKIERMVEQVLREGEA
jgi:hypothetical protein